MQERVWMIAAVLMVIIAGIFFWRNNLSAAFVIAALGACAWFLSYRAQLRAKLPDDDETDEDSNVSTESGSDRVETHDQN